MFGMLSKKHGNLPRNGAGCPQPKDFSGKNKILTSGFSWGFLIGLFICLSAFLLRERESIFSIKVNQNSVKSVRWLCSISCSSPCRNSFSSTTVDIYWPLTDLFQTIQSWSFQDFSGLCLTTEGQQDRLLTERPGTTPRGREASETPTGLSVKTRRTFTQNSQNPQPKAGSVWAWTPSTWIEAPEMSSKTGMNTLKCLGKSKFA